MRMSDWSSVVCSSDLCRVLGDRVAEIPPGAFDRLGLAAIGDRPVRPHAKAGQDADWLLTLDLEPEARLRAACDPLRGEGAAVVEHATLRNAELADQIGHGNACREDRFGERRGGGKGKRVY